MSMNRHRKIYRSAMILFIISIICSRMPVKASEPSGVQTSLSHQQILYLNQLLTSRIKEKNLTKDEIAIISEVRRNLQMLKPVEEEEDRRLLEDKLKNLLRNQVAQKPEDKTSRQELARYYIYLDELDMSIQHLNKIPVEQQQELYKPLLTAYCHLRLGEYLLAEPKLKEVDEAVGVLLPLRLQNLSFCTRVRGMGQYTPRENSDFKPQEVTWVYFELVGGEFSIDATKTYHLKSILGLEIRDALQQMVWEKQEYCEFNPSYQHRVRTVFGGMDFIIPEGLRPGKYSLVILCNDLLSGKKTRNTVSFTILGE